jgi:K+-sensing histidine kinase KdpD
MNEMIGSVPELDGAAVIAFKIGENAGAKRHMNGEPFRHMTISDGRPEEVVTIDIEEASHMAPGVPSGHPQSGDVKANAAGRAEAQTGNRPDGTPPAERGDENEYLSVLESAAFTLREAMSVCFASATVLFNELEDIKKSETLPYLAMIKHNQYKLLHLTQNIECILTAGKGKRRAGPTDLNRLCSNLVGTISSLLAGSGIGFLFFSRCEHAVISADYMHIELMLLNLFCDSIKRVPEGGEIVLVLCENSGSIMLNISVCGYETAACFPDDTAGRSKPEERFKIFGGAGLGMVSAIRIAELYNGNIFMNMQESGVKTISVVLPGGCEQCEDTLPQTCIYSEDSMNRVLAGLSDVLDYTHFMGLYES